MAPNDAESPSAAARDRGNALYRRGKLAEAEKAYLEAVELDPGNPMPLSNLSAVKFERGQYIPCIDFLKKALELLKGSEDADISSRRTRLYCRMGRCLLHSLQVHGPDADLVLRELSGDSGEEKEIKAALEETRAHVAVGKDAQMGKIIDRLVPFKPGLLTRTEYYAVGHDIPESLCDDDLVKKIKPDEVLALLFCGSGDARHVFSTMSFLGIAKRRGGSSVFKSVHITIVDIHAAAIARTMILFDMLQTYATMRLLNKPGLEDTLLIIAYMYSCHVVPPFVVDRIHVHLDGIIRDLENAKMPGPFMFIPPETMSVVLFVLYMWRKWDELDSVASMRDYAMKEFNRLQKESKEDVLEGCEQDVKSMSQLGVVFPHDKVLQKDAPPLWALVDAHRNQKSATATKDLTDYLESTWQINPTVNDVPNHPVSFNTVTVASHIAESLGGSPHPQTSKRGVLGTISAYFELISASFVDLVGNLTVEMVVGEMTDLLERLAHRKMDWRSMDQISIFKPREFPFKYERIHMSNIPDYVGGPLTALLLGRPVLANADHAAITFINLLNPPEFQTHEHFQTESTLMPQNKNVEDMFFLKRKPSPPVDPERLAMVQMMGVGEFVTEPYMVWHSLPEKPTPAGRMMTKPELERWLIGFLLKVEIPYPRAPHSSAPVYSPLNITMWIRLLAQAHKAGYLAHWISGLLSRVCEGAVETTARAPVSRATSAKDVAKWAKNPKLNLSTLPYRAEITTMLSLWRSILPFGIMGPPNAIPPLSAVSQYEIKFPNFSGIAADANMVVKHFIIVFYRGALPSGGLREMLTGTDNAAQSKIHVLTTWQHPDFWKKMGTFWLRDDVVESMSADRAWKAYIWRTDTWVRVSPGVVVATGLKKTRSW